jgi:hypothetical protein
VTEERCEVDHHCKHGDQDAFTAKFFVPPGDHGTNIESQFNKSNRGQSITNQLAVKMFEIAAGSQRQSAMSR